MSLLVSTAFRKYSLTFKSDIKCLKKIYDVLVDGFNSYIDSEIYVKFVRWGKSANLGNTFSISMCHFR